jgi:hypothetical protein
MTTPSLIIEKWVVDELEPPAGGTAYSVTASGFAYTWTLSAALFSRGRTLSANGFLYTYSFGDALFSRGRTLSAEGLLYTQGLGAAVFSRGKTLPADGLSYTWVLGAANFTHTPGVVIHQGNLGFNHGGIDFRRRRLCRRIRLELERQYAQASEDLPPLEDLAPGVMQLCEALSPAPRGMAEAVRAAIQQTMEAIAQGRAAVKRAQRRNAELLLLLD